LLYALRFHPDDPVVSRRELTAALGVDDGEGELGRAETGATCALVDGARGVEIWLPVVRAPWSARDLLPTLVDAAQRLGRRFHVDDPLAAWDEAHARTCGELGRACAAQDLPPPPYLPAAELARLHALLIESAAPPPGPPVVRPIWVLDPADGTPARPAVRLPRVDEAAQVRLPAVGHALCDLHPGHGGCASASPASRARRLRDSGSSRLSRSSMPKAYSAIDAPS
jgi:hypothetical protein